MSGGCDGGLFVVEFPFVEYKVCVINGMLMYSFHEIFYASFWDV